MEELDIKIGDTVTGYDFSNNDRYGSNWCDLMHPYVGKQGRVITVHKQLWFGVDFGGGVQWDYPKEYIKYMKVGIPYIEPSNNVKIKTESIVVSLKRKGITIIKPNLPNVNHISLKPTPAKVGVNFISDEDMDRILEYSLTGKELSEDRESKMNILKEDIMEAFKCNRSTWIYKDTRLLSSFDFISADYRDAHGIITESMADLENDILGAFDEGVLFQTAGTLTTSCKNILIRLINDGDTVRIGKFLRSVEGAIDILATLLISKYGLKKIVEDVVTHEYTIEVTINNKKYFYACHW